MPSAEYYEQQAKLLFEMAAATTDRAQVDRLVGRANRYIRLAQSAAGPTPPQVHGQDHPQQQQMQQQRQQRTGEDQ